MKEQTHAGQEQPLTHGRRLARARAVLRILLRQADRGVWVAPGVLGCAYPYTDRALVVLSEQGVRLLVNLHVRPHEPALLKRYGLRELHLLVKDFAPPSPEQIDHAVQTILKVRATEEGVAVHCGGGLGRTGTLPACYLAKAQELDAEEALRRVRILRPGSVETQSQTAAIGEWIRRMPHTETPRPEPQRDLRWAGQA